MEPEYTPRVDLSGLRGAAERARQEIHKIIVGQDEMLTLLLAALLADGHVLIEGVPGVAKTLTARLMARVLDVPFKRIQFTPDLMPADVIGTSVFNPEARMFEFRKGPLFASLVLVDEINRAPAKTQSALFEAMQERQVTADGTTYPLDRPFLLVATQNPVEHEGTYRLPEAQLDRFLFRIDVGYPSLEEETAILTTLHERDGRFDLEEIQPVLTAADVRQYQEAVRRVHVEEKVAGYVARLVQGTRSHPAVYLGASPRASVALMTAAQALAALNGNDFITPEDVQRAARPVLGHRLLLTPEREMEGTRPADVIRQLIEQVEVPR